MQSSLFVILGVLLIIMGGAGLLSGNVMAGSKGLKPNYYNRVENPTLFYLFVFIYIAIGIFVMIKSI